MMDQTLFYILVGVAVVIMFGVVAFYNPHRRQR